MAEVVKSLLRMLLVLLLAGICGALGAWVTGYWSAKLIADYVI